MGDYMTIKECIVSTSSFTTPGHVITVMLRSRPRSGTHVQASYSLYTLVLTYLLHWAFFFLSFLSLFM